MKTSEKTVVVAVLDNGKSKRHVYPIATDDGELMASRLSHLLQGRLGRSHSDDESGPEGHVIHFVGMVWKAPYTLLQEILQDRLSLQRDLLIREGHTDLTDIAPIVIPEKASSGKITTLMQSELKLRRTLKKRLRALDAAEENAKASNTVAETNVTDSGIATCTPAAT